MVGFMGPSDFKTLASYDLNLEKIVTLGWIIRWINRFIFVPLFGFLGSYIAYGIAIIILQYW
jgi:YidC/Oxa1 family membrane protein insertase